MTLILAFFFVSIPSDNGSKNKLNKWEHSKLWKRMGRLLKTLKEELLDGPAIQTLGIYPKKTKNTNKKHMHLMFTAALFAIAKIWKQSKCLSIDE